MSSSKGGGCGDGLFNIGCWIVLGGAGTFILVLILLGVFANNVWQTGQQLDVQPQEMAQTATEATTSPVGVFVIACVILALIGVGVVKAVFGSSIGG